MKKLQDYAIISLSEVVPDENQPRKLFEPSKLKQLKDSVNKYGVMTPLTVEKVGDKYLIVDGERRYRVAKDLGLKEVPATIIAPQSSIDRLVQQFHIQEQHEEWTPTEKAVTVYQLSKELGVSLPQVCQLLALDDRTARRYMAFADIIDKKSFQRNEIGIIWAEYINHLKSLVKRLYSEMDKDFTRVMEKELETAIIARIKNGEIRKVNDLTKLKDSFTKEPKLIEKFLNTAITANTLFIESKAKPVFYLRNAFNNAGYVVNHLRRFLENPDVKLTAKQIEIFKLCNRYTKELLDKVSD